MPQFGGSVPQLIADAGHALLFDPRWREQGSKQRTCDLSTICRFCSFSSDSVPDRAASEKSGHDASCMLSTGVRRLVMSYRPTLMHRAGGEINAICHYSPPGKAVPPSCAENSFVRLPVPAAPLAFALNSLS